MALASTNGSSGVSANEGVEVDVRAAGRRTTIVIKTVKPYPEVKARIEKLGRFDDAMRAMLQRTTSRGYVPPRSAPRERMAWRSTTWRFMAISWRSGASGVR
ncbi:MAG: hypothetical protein WDN50_06490 [Bradyrhizobium sp.]